jgi:hypothetical protein
VLPCGKCSLARLSPLLGDLVGEKRILSVKEYRLHLDRYLNEQSSNIFGTNMNFTTESTSKQFANTFNSSNPHLTDAVATTTALFKRLSVDNQLALLWYIYTEMGRSITPAAVGAARLQLAEGVLNQIKQMSLAQQLEVMRDLAAKKNTQISRSYGIWSANTKLAFWYELSELMVKDLVIPMPSNYQPSRDVVQVLEAIKQLEFGQQITVLRNSVVDMGVDPLGTSK